MPITLRPLDLAHDTPHLAELLTTAKPDPTTLAMLHEQARTLPIGPDCQRIVAVADQGWIAGFVEVGHYPWLPAQHFWLWVVVDPCVEHRGIGTQLHHTALAFARERGATRLYSQVRDDCQACLDFAQQRGFTIARRLWESTLDLFGFDERRFAGIVDAVAATGIRFFTLTDVDDTALAQRQLYELNRLTGQDNPSNTTAFPSFAEFRALVFGAPWYRADGQIIAADGAQWVGMASVGYFADANVMDNMFTGVMRAYRGRKIAQALKLLAIQCARTYGATLMRTSNDSQNAPMLAINQQLGYQPRAGRYRLMQDLR